MNQEWIQKAFDLSLNYLSYGSRTEKEMVDYLEKKVVSPKIIAAVMAKLMEYHYVDDVAYVTMATSSNVHGNRYGFIRLKQKLSEKGISPELLNRLREFYPLEDEVDCCRHHLEKALKKYAHETRTKKVQKISAFLQRRGFKYDMIREEIGAIHWQEEDDEVSREANGEELLRYYQKYRRMQENKGYEGWELKRRISRNLASRGFHYDDIRDIVNGEGVEE